MKTTKPRFHGIFFVCFISIFSYNICTFTVSVNGEKLFSVHLKPENGNSFRVQYVNYRSVMWKWKMKLLCVRRQCLPMEYTIYTRLDYSTKERHVPEKVIFFLI